MTNPDIHTFLAFDFGLRHIGVATAQTRTATSTPLAVLRAKSGVPDWNQIAALIEEWQPAAMVVGLPLNMDGTESDMSARARKFAHRLEGRFRLAVHLVDERLSSHEARLRGGAQRGGAQRNGPQRNDALAAKVIAETFLETLPQTC